MFETETSPALTPYYSIRAQELALRVTNFKQLGVSPDSGMMWLRFGIRKLTFHQFLRKLKNLVFQLTYNNLSERLSVSKTIEIQI